MAEQQKIEFEENILPNSKKSKKAWRKIRGNKEIVPLQDFLPDFDLKTEAFLKREKRKNFTDIYYGLMVDEKDILEKLDYKLNLRMPLLQGSNLVPVKSGNPKLRFKGPKTPKGRVETSQEIKMALWKKFTKNELTDLEKIAKIVNKLKPSDTSREILMTLLAFADGKEAPQVKPIGAIHQNRVYRHLVSKDGAPLGIKVTADVLAPLGKMDKAPIDACEIEAYTPKQNKLVEELHRAALEANFIDWKGTRKKYMLATQAQKGVELPLAYEPST